MTTYNAHWIVWDAPESAALSLPKRAYSIEADDSDEVANILSDEYGWCVVSLETDEADTRPDPMSLAKERMEDEVCLN